MYHLGTKKLELGFLMLYQFLQSLQVVVLTQSKTISSHEKLYFIGYLAISFIWLFFDRGHICISWSLSDYPHLVISCYCLATMTTTEGENKQISTVTTTIVIWCQKLWLLL